MFFLVCNLGLFNITEREPIKHGVVLLSHLKTISTKVVSFLNLYTERSNKNALQFGRVVDNLKTLKTSKGVVWYSSARPSKFEAPEICRVCAMVNLALRRGITPHATPLLGKPSFHEPWIVKERVGKQENSRDGIFTQSTA